MIQSYSNLNGWLAKGGFSKESKLAKEEYFRNHIYILIYLYVVFSDA